MDLWTDLCDSFSPPASAWWYTLLAVTMLVVLCLALVAAYWPRRLNGPLTDKEERSTSGSALLRWWWPVVRVVAVSVALLAALAVLVLGPRRPYTLQYQASQDNGDAAFWAEKCPTEHARRHKLDPRPLVQTVLAQARQEGAEQWQIADDSYRQRLRELCLQALLGPTAADRAVETERLPAWVRTSVEMTIIHGLLQRENVPWAGIRCPAATPAWERAQRLLGAGRTVVQLFPDSVAGPVRVRALFNGTISSTGNVAFSALVEGAPGTSAALTFFLFAHGEKKPAASLRQVVTLSQQCRVVPITGSLPGLPSGRLLVSNEEGTVQTPLTGSDSPPLVVAVQGVGASASQLVNAVQRILAADALAERLEQQGLPRLKFENRQARPDEVALVVRADAVLVLAPGLAPASVVSGDWHAVAVPEPSYARRISNVGDQFPVATSWMSVTLRATPADLLPKPSDHDRPHVGGLLMNQKLHEGRRLDRSKATASFAVVEQGQNGKVVRFRFHPQQQGLLADSDPSKLPEAWEPGRAQAFAASVAWAVDRVLYQELPPSPEGAEATTLLTCADQEALSERGRRATDAGALCILGSCLLTMLWQAVSWRRAKRPG
jgi:hypothetical protein